MIGSLVGAGLSAIGSIFGGLTASKAMKKVKKNLESQKAANQNWYDRRYYEDTTQRADAQRILARTEAAVRERNRAAAGAQAVMGGTEESVASAKAANNQALADAASSIAAAGEARKDRIEDQFRQRDGQLDEQLNNKEIGKAQGVSQAIGGVASAAGDLGTSIDEYMDNRRKDK